jgi:hypothetical protein
MVLLAQIRALSDTMAVRVCALHVKLAVQSALVLRPARAALRRCTFSIVILTLVRYRAAPTATTTPTAALRFAVVAIRSAQPASVRSTQNATLAQAQEFISLLAQVLAQISALLVSTALEMFVFRATLRLAVQPAMVARVTPA